jgi:hypothetical protein
MMAMAFASGGRNAGLFDMPPYYGTPGIGDDLLRGMAFDTGPAAFDNAPAGQPVDASAGGPSRMAFRGGGRAGTSAPASLMPLDTPLAPSGLDSQALSPLPGVQPKKPGFFESGGGFRDVVGILGDALAGAAGGQPVYGPMKMRQRQQQTEWDRQDALRRQDREWAVEDRDWKRNQPDYFMSGRDRVRFDPSTGQSQVVYDGATDFQEYADLLGLEPGSDEYDEAMQDFVLRSNGPTAQAGRVALEGVRQGNRVDLEGVRQGNRAALRQMPTYANLHPRPAAGGGSGGNGGGRPPRTTGNVYAPILAKLAAGQALTPGEQQVISMYGRGNRSGGAGGTAGGAGSIPTVKTPADAAKLAKGTRYRTPDGRVMVR